MKNATIGWRAQRTKPVSRVAARIWRSNQAGLPPSSSGATTSVSSRCWSMCTVNRYWSPIVSSGVARAISMTTTRKAVIAAPANAPMIAQ